MQEQELEKLGFSYTYSGPYKAGVEVATHYGFRLIPPVRGIHSLRSEIGPRHQFHKEHYIDPAHKILIQNYVTSLNEPKNMQYMICHTRSPKKKGAGGIGLHIIGNNRSIAEALIIKTSLSILAEYGYKNLVVEINSLGDKTSNKVFLKELLNHYRRNISAIGDCCRTHMKNNPLMVVTCLNEACISVRNDAPRPINYLSESGRDHLKNIIEYLESMNTTYRINNDLIGEFPESGTQVSFIIKEDLGKDICDEQILARGERYNRFTLNNQIKKTMPSVGALIDIKKSGKEEYKNPQQKIPSIYLVHLGIEAKRKSLEIIEMFRQKNIPIAQSLIYDDLAKQIKRAESMSINYTIIMGLKEARERAVIVRNTSTRAQEIVPFDSLLKYVKHINRL